MKIKNIGVNINKDTIIDETYKAPQNRKNIKLCEKTNFGTGFIEYEDGIFLPEGTYVMLKEKGKQDKIGRIFHFYTGTIEEDKIRAAIVDIHYDMESSKNRLKMNDELIIGFIYKNMAGINHNKNKFLQVISYEETENDKWNFVRVEYGNPNVKMFYMYGWQYWNGTIYSKKDLSSEKILCFKQHHYFINIYNDVYSNNKITNIEYKIPLKSKFAPYEEELIIIYIILLGVTFIFNGRAIIWTLLTILFIKKRKELRDKYNG